MNVRKIRGDILTVKNCISPSGNPTNDECLYDVAAFHLQQAVEKGLKYYLHDVYGVDDTTRTFKTHDIANLLNQLDQYDPLFSNNHEEIVSIADRLNDWEANARYNLNIVATRTEIEEMVPIAENLLSEIQTLEAQREAKL